MGGRIPSPRKRFADLLFWIWPGRLHLHQLVTGAKSRYASAEWLPPLGCLIK